MVVLNQVSDWLRIDGSVATPPNFIPAVVLDEEKVCLSPAVYVLAWLVWTMVDGNPVALVRLIAEGVPRAGVIKAGEVAKTTAPVPV